MVSTGDGAPGNSAFARAIPNPSRYYFTRHCSAQPSAHHHSTTRYPFRTDAGSGSILGSALRWDMAVHARIYISDAKARVASDESLSPVVLSWSITGDRASPIPGVRSSARRNASPSVNRTTGIPCGVPRLQVRGMQPCGVKSRGSLRGIDADTKGTMSLIASSVPSCCPNG